MRVCLSEILGSNILTKIIKMMKVKMRRMRAREGVRVCLGEILGSSGIPNTPPTSGIPSTVAGSTHAQ